MSACPASNNRMISVSSGGVLPPSRFELCGHFSHAVVLADGSLRLQARSHLKLLIRHRLLMHFHVPLTGQRHPGIPNGDVHLQPHAQKIDAGVSGVNDRSGLDVGNDCRARQTSVRLGNLNADLSGHHIGASLDEFRSQACLIRRRRFAIEGQPMDVGQRGREIQRNANRHVQLLAERHQRCLVSDFRHRSLATGLPGSDLGGCHILSNRQVGLITPFLHVQQMFVEIRAAAAKS